ncbi:MAG: hypothetical protein ACRCTD_13935 [Beijerinckiaceae bacterium]
MRIVKVALPCVLALAGLSGTAMAKSCLDDTSGAKLSPVNEPVAELLSRYSFGGLGLSGAARDAIVRNVDAAPQVLQLLDSANPAQKSSLARGLGLAAANCQPYHPQAALNLRTMVAERGDPEAMREFVIAQAGSGVSILAKAATSAQSAPAAGTGGGGKCYVGPAPATPEAVRDVSANPASLLSQHPIGGPGMTNDIRNLVMTDDSVIAALGKITSSATPLQKTAVAAGLAQAANACELLAPQVAQAIQRFVVAQLDADIERTFRAITGDRSVAATFAGPAFGPASPGGGGSVNGGAVTTGSQGGNAFATPSRSAPFSFASSSASITPRTAAQTLFSSVSP